MVRFEVTGATPEEFAENAMKAWGLLAIGLQQALSVQPAPNASPPLKMVSTPISPTSGSESSSTASKVTLVADKVDDLFVLENPSFKTEEQKTADPAPEVAGTKASTEKKTKGPKLDDLKTRLSEVIVAATERWDQKRANAYARKLLKEFAVEKLSELGAEQYGAFMHGSNPYLSGDISE